MGSQPPGGWTGSVVTFDGGSVCKSVKKDLWTKVQSKVRWLAQHVGLWAPHSSPEADIPAPEDEKPSPSSIHFKTTESFYGVPGLYSRDVHQVHALPQGYFLDAQ